MTLEFNVNIAMLPGTEAQDGSKRPPRVGVTSGFSSVTVLTDSLEVRGVAPRRSETVP